MTESGQACQRWDSQKPHSHSHRADDFPEKDLSLASNHCRNPNGRTRPWCYTTDPDIEWDYCKLGRCHTGTNWIVHVCMAANYLGADYWMRNIPVINIHGINRIKKSFNVKLGNY